MASNIALFPLTSALVPGLLLPLHIFEPRYRLMVQELLQRPQEDREFGMVSVRSGTGQPSGSSGPSLSPDALFTLGVSAMLREATELDDGRFDIVCVGGRRFTLLSVDTSRPLWRAQVEFLPDPILNAEDPAIAPVVSGALSALERYRTSLRGLLGEDHLADEALPQDPTVLSYLITAALTVDPQTRTDLLAAVDGAERLRRAIRIMRIESTLIDEFRSVPGADSLTSQFHPN